ncbi:MAG TPA: 16S rRNA (cytosine(1402)-N(4))-methyltransferase RsmH [Xanthobacteraceae bacterium]|jgi:16S rRNA (cytosine1402-N4)-methyltransferase
MTASRDSAGAVAGGLVRHIPVLARPAIELLNVRPGGLYIDATFGAGGYTRAILDRAECRVIGIDRDVRAIALGAELAQAAGDRLILVEDRFSNLQAVAERCGQGLEVEGIVFDLGVSSMQLDDAERGFSFRHDAPLDMRMGGEGPSAADVVAHASEQDLTAIIRMLGEEHHARAVARALVAARRNAPIRSTRALADIVTRVVRARPGAIHPATRTFQALRIFVNEELSELAAGLAAAERLLKRGGRLVVVAFHSLEDRMVKSFLAGRDPRQAPSRHRPEPAPPAATFRVLTRRPVTPDEAEIAANPRARSARLRAAERSEASPPPAANRVSSLLPRLPSPGEIVASARSEPRAPRVGR